MPNNQLGTFTPFQDDLLIQSEALIENQRATISQLKAKLKDLKNIHQRSSASLQTDLKQLQQSNAKLRLEIDLLQGELVARNYEDDDLVELRKKYESEINESQRTLEELRKSFGELSRAHEEGELERVKVLKENEELTRRLASLKASAPSAEASLNEELKSVEKLERLKAQIGEYEAVLRALTMKCQEARITKSGLVDSELELMEAREVIEQQKARIHRLQTLIDSLNREKGLMPPTLLMMKSLPSREDQTASTNKANDQRLLLEIRSLLENVQPQQSQPVASTDKTLLVQVISSLNELSRRQVDIDKRIEASTNSDPREFVRVGVKHGKFQSPASPVPLKPADLLLFSSTLTEPSMVGRTLSMSKSHLSLFSLDNGYEPIQSFEQPRCVITWDQNNFIAYLRYQKESDDVEVHKFEFKNKDDFSKFFLGGQYAGLIAEGVKQKTEVVNPKCKVIVADGKYIDGSNGPWSRTAMNLEFDVELNRVIFRDGSGAMVQSISASNCLFQADPVEKDFKFWVYPDAVSQVKPSVMMVVFDKPESQYTELLPMALGLKWRSTYIGDGDFVAPGQDEQKAPPRLASPPLPNGRKGSPSDSSSPTSESEDDFDSFQISDKSIKLYENRHSEPVLTLEAKNCVCQANDNIRSFVLTRMTPDGVGDEQFCFEFEDNIKYFEKKALLEENGFFEKAADAVKLRNEVAVVTKDRLELFKNYGDPDEVPYLQISASNARAICNSQRREIQILEKLSSGKGRKLNMDCATTKEYYNWYNALVFSGFTKDSVDEPSVSRQNAYSKMKQYVFPVRFIGDDGRNRWMEVTPSNLRIYEDETRKSLLYGTTKNACVIYTSMANRGIRIARGQVGVGDGDRMDLELPTIAAYDEIITSFKKSGYEMLPLDQGKFTHTSPKGGLASTKVRGILYWKKSPKAMTKDPADYAIPSTLFQAHTTPKQVVFKPRTVDTIPSQLTHYHKEMKELRFSCDMSSSQEVQQWKLVLFVGRFGTIENGRAPIISYLFGLNKAGLACLSPDGRKKSPSKTLMNSFTNLVRERPQLTTPEERMSLAQALAEENKRRATQSPPDIGSIDLTRHSSTLNAQLSPPIMIKKGGHSGNFS